MNNREFQAKIVVACALLVFSIIVGLKIYNYVSK
jgi:hypothetical protein